ncbi:GntR family transcriptional regulator [Amaricoccus sp. W119]|uniref:GntR family transcriptional regulator n=1 Tax=Amaricoccus sp. W119 TaxID=3391833 RepID=UPI0039A64358
MVIGTTTAAQVTADLRRRILLGELVPGQRLKIDEIASLCGVSHMPVRTALQELEAEGVLLVHPRRGAEIRMVDADYITSMLDVRGAIEAMLAGKCAALATAAEIEQIEQLAREFEQRADEDDATALLRANFRLHSFINAVPRNAEAIHTLNRGRLLIETLRMRFGYGGARLGDLVREHREIVAAIARRDVAMARAVAQEHCDHARDELLRLVGSEDRPDQEQTADR